MGYNSNCYYQTCYYNCCNYYGSCPSSYSGCYYYYNTDAGVGQIIGIVIGCLIGLAILIGLICCCVKRQQIVVSEPIVPIHNRTIVIDPNYNSSYGHLTYGMPNYDTYGRTTQYEQIHVQSSYLRG